MKKTVEFTPFYSFSPKIKNNIMYNTVEEAIKELKLDRRHKWEEFGGELVYPYWYTAPCSGCSETREMQAKNERGNGCHECGYKGKRRCVVPVPAFIPDGSIVKIKK